jgi:hypothetical protein
MDANPAWLQWLLRGIADAYLTLVGMAPPSDFVQEVIGGRALLNGGNPYPIAPPLIEFGLTQISGYSTHPPTAFLLAIPVAWLPWPVAAQIWAWLMLGCFVVMAWAFRLRWYVALACLPLLFWPPVTWSLGQLTPIWMTALALAWRWRGRTSAAGALIGLAALTKFLPAISLVPLIRARRWHAAAAFAAVWLAAISILLLLDRGAIPSYLHVNLGAAANAATQTERLDNGALLPFALRYMGVPGVVMVAAVLLAVALLAFRGDADSPERWALWTWLGVALLPVAWTYSLLPLLPWLLRTVRRGGATERLLAVLAFLPPFAGAAPSSVPEVVVATIALSGLAFTAAAIRERSPVHIASPAQPIGRMLAARQSGQ